MSSEFKKVSVIDGGFDWSWVNSVEEFDTEKMLMEMWNKAKSLEQNGFSPRNILSKASELVGIVTQLR